MGGGTLALPCWRVVQMCECASCRVLLAAHHNAWVHTSSVGPLSASLLPVCLPFFVARLKRIFVVIVCGSSCF